MGAALSAFVLSRSSRHVKDAGFTHPVTRCRLRVEGKRCVSKWCVRWALSLALPFSSAGEICDSCFVTLPLNWTKLKKEPEKRCREGMTVSILSLLCSNEKKIYSVSLLEVLNPRKMKAFFSPHLPPPLCPPLPSSPLPSIPHWLCGVLYDSVQGLCMQIST